MASSLSSKLTLRHITPLQHSNNDRRADDAPSTRDTQPLLGTTTLPHEVTRLMTSRVVIDVGAKNGEDAVVSYSCPLFILQAASSTLRDLLLDAVETEAPHATTAAACSSTNADAPTTVVPLPFLRPTTFITLALYMEHFYGLGADQVCAPNDATTPASSQSAVDGPQARWSVSEWEVTSEGRHPMDFHVPLRLEDLYRLSAWEHHFVAQRLLQLEVEDARYTHLLEDGSWIDAIAVARHTGKGTAPHTFISESQQRACMDELVRTLEAATRLGIAPLQSLCAAVLSNMLIDRPEEDLLALLAPPSRGAKPPFTAERKKELLSQFSWLQDVPNP